MTCLVTRPDLVYLLHVVLSIFTDLQYNFLLTCCRLVVTFCAASYRPTQQTTQQNDDKSN